MRLRNKRITPYIFEKHFPNQRRNERRLSSFPEANLIGNTTSYTYNYMGLVAAETNEKNATRYYSYDALGRLVSKTDRNGRITTYTYDTIGRLTAENWSNTTNYFMYTYDAVGNLLYATDGQHSYSYAYDALNRPIYTTFNFDSQSAVFAYTYDLAGRQTASSLSLNGHSDRVNQTTYDFLGNATSVRQTGSAVDEIFAEFNYNANGLMTSVKRYEVDGNNLINEIAESLYTYNANNAVTSITHKNPNGTQIVQHSYTYDNTNNIVEYLNSIDGQTSYDYDFLGQLIGADYSNQNLDDETYTYDENGNRITANGDTYTTGDNNELTSDGTWSYTYDAEGNRISKTNATNRELYTWDHRNRLTSVTQQEWDSVEQDWTTTQIVEYAYDYNNVWIRKTIGNNKTIFIPENYQTTVQIDNNTVTHHYLWTPNQQDKLLADTTPNSTSWALTDHLGTIRDILAATATHLIYDAFGNLTSGTNPILFGYTGKAFDSVTQLQNNINRWYDATTGRWLSTDPIGFEGNDKNLYRYVNNRSIIFIDTKGLEDEWHHLLPQEFRNDFKAFFDIDSAEFGWIIDEIPHRRVNDNGKLHPKWNQEWGQFFDDIKKDGRKPSKREILAQLEKLKNDSQFKHILALGKQANMSKKDWDKAKEALRNAAKFAEQSGKKCCKNVSQAVKICGKANKVIGVVIITYNATTGGLTYAAEEGVKDLVWPIPLLLDSVGRELASPLTAATDSIKIRQQEAEKAYRDPMNADLDSLRPGGRGQLNNSLLWRCLLWLAR